ncbi:MAG: hypothetical protein V7703_10630 [Hyphomicrobiales bacterium]
MTIAIKSLTSSVQAVVLSICTVAAISTFTADSAEAKTLTKPLVNGYSMYYKNKDKAKDSARYRWGLAAAEAHGSEWAHWGKAKQKSINCSWVDVPGKPNAEAWRCRASAKPAKEVRICKGILSAKGMFYVKKSKAQESATYRWGLKAASTYGQSFAHWGKAGNPDFSCSKGPKGLWNCTATAKACQ